MQIAARKYQLAAMLLSMLFVTTAVVRASSAAFSDTTDNPGNSFAAGDVVIADDDGGATAMFSMTNAKPGSTATKCVNVSYTGTLDAEVKMYGALDDAGTGLANYLDVEIVRGTGAAGGVTFDCTGFAAGTTVWSTAGPDGDLGDFMTATTDYSTGEDLWAVTGGAPTDTASYQFVVTVQDDTAAQGLTAPSVSFTWEAQNT